MNQFVFNCDNTGNLVSSGLISADPIAASGQTLDQATSTALTVVADATYAITACVGYLLLGQAAVSTAANIVWVAAEGQTIHVKVPVGVTTLYYMAVGTSPLSFLRRLN
jgi:hypothetical protein